MTVRVGVAVHSVDVPVGTAMGGYAGRLASSSGVHDATTVRAIAIAQMVLVAVDVCALHEDTCAEIARSHPDLTVVVSAVHTHAGPSIGRGRVGRHEPHLEEAVVAAARRAIATARSNQRPVLISSAAVHGTKVARDRRRLARVIDPPLAALAFSDPTSGRRVATLIEFPCHPVVLDASNTLISADYVHALRRDVEQHTGAPCVFVTGAAGDVNLGHAATASFTNRPDEERTFDSADAIGGRLAAAVSEAEWTPLQADRSTTLRSGSAQQVRWQEATVELPFDAVDPPALARRRAGWVRSRETADAGVAAVLTCWIDWADAWQPPAPGRTWRGRVGYLSLAGAGIVTLPGEPFLAVADAIRAAAQVPVLVAAYSDGVPGYFPTADAYPAGGYEVEDACMYYAMPAPFAPGCAELLVQAAQSLIRGAEQVEDTSAPR